jgi:hypothetical protein
VTSSEKVYRRFSRARIDASSVLSDSARNFTQPERNSIKSAPRFQCSRVPHAKTYYYQRC